ncbi:MAG: DNA polymerase IV [Candidatus Parcubacteria bacterium]|nr:DNA polymerase IV [Candidatus Parcubacteria bacterium]
MNSYFASVEQQANPFLRNKAVGVVAYMSPNGCIIASSKEAKKLGIKTGCLVKDAKKLCPDVVLIENEPAKYRSTTERIFSIFSDYTDRIEPYSIDEAFLDLTGYIKTWQEGEKIIREIKQRVKAEVGEWLTSSCGLSWTRFLAKFASDICPKDSYLIIDSIPKMEETFKQVKIIEAWGIKQATERHLNRLGIFTLNDLKRHPVANLMQSFGKPGYYLWANANGIEIEGVRTQEEILPKSIGHSYCIPKQTNDPKYLSAILMKLCEKTGRRLRESQLEARGIVAGYSLKYGGGFWQSHKTADPLFTTQDIFKAAYGLIQPNWPAGKVYMLAVSVTRLQRFSGQLNLFYSPKQKNLTLAMDKINDKFGEYTICSGTMWDTKDNAPDRVGFRKSVNVNEKASNITYDDSDFF